MIKWMTAMIAGTTADAAPKDDRAAITNVLHIIRAALVPHIIQDPCAKNAARSLHIIIIRIHNPHIKDAKNSTREDLKIA